MVSPDFWEQALLEGKKIYAAEEGIELYEYRDTAPKAFYGRLEANLQMLKDSGLMIAAHEQIPDLILHGADTEAPGGGVRKSRPAAMQRQLQTRTGNCAEELPEDCTGQENHYRKGYDFSGKSAE